MKVERLKNLPELYDSKLRKEIVAVKAGGDRDSFRVLIGVLHGVGFGV